ncbi:MAG TPA: hypothetical protein ENG83_00830 [Nitrospirae bacterium]|nr:hypothetical protein [Nitrospirota bacterium]HDZ03036.1 hypothetical protein [Nitrospirota bacterium]
MTGIVIGGLTGAGLYAYVYPLLKNTILEGKTPGYLTIDKLLGVNPWIVIVGLSVMVLAVFYAVERYEMKMKP